MKETSLFIFPLFFTFSAFDSEFCLNFHASIQRTQKPTNYTMTSNLCLWRTTFFFFCIFFLQINHKDRWNRGTETDRTKRYCDKIWPSEPSARQRESLPWQVKFPHQSTMSGKENRCQIGTHKWGKSNI